MKFLVDAQLPPALARWLIARGHQAEHVADLGLLAATDREIAQRAEDTGAILISKDENFLRRWVGGSSLIYAKCSKPDEFHGVIEACSPGSRLELFARGERPGWTGWSYQAENYEIGWETYAHNLRSGWMRMAN